jgi:hypothetical protein
MISTTLISKLADKKSKQKIISYVVLGTGYSLFVDRSLRQRINGKIALRPLG